jgi:outer membrane receptor protein involved in Fe transport
VAPWLTLDAGVDLEAAATSLRRLGSVGLPAREGDRRTFGQPIPDQVNADAWQVQSLAVAPWVEADFALADGRVHLTPGLRVDPYLQRVSRRTPPEGDLPAVGLQRADVTLEPRLAVRWSPSTRFTLKAAAGRYAQLPQPEDLSAVFGTPTLGVSTAPHALLGATWRPVPSLTVEATVFGTLSEGLAMRSEDPAPLRANALVATGEGRAYGAQVMIRQELTRGLMGWVSYALVRSERRTGPGLPWRLFDQDQTHVLTALVQWEPGAGWELGARVRYATGMPRTPVVGAWFDAQRDQWQPLLGAQNIIRLPDFVQLDVRVAKTFRLGASRLEVSLEVQNVTNRENPEEITWNAAWTRSGNITGLPILPVLGARWTL